MFSNFARFVVIPTFILSTLMSPVTFAKCTKPTIRKEWRKLSVAEKANWTQAVNCLSRLPHDGALTPTVKPNDISALNISGSYWDDIVYMHMDLNHIIHFTGLFLPWHRWYVHFVETALRTKCSFTGTSPYWDWSQDAADVYGSSFFSDDSPTSGLGGWGDPTRDYQVPSGAFSNLHLSYPSPHILRRNFTLQPWITIAPFFPLITDPSFMANVSFTMKEVKKMVDGFVGDFKGFQQYLESPNFGAHSNIHEIVGGDLSGQCPSDAPAGCQNGATFSANDPIFFMHHAMVDKIWSDWQNKHPSNFWSFNGGSVQEIANLTEYTEYPNGASPALTLDTVMPSDGMFPSATIRDVMDTTGSYLCYVYE
jgi:tyrosinase